LSGFQALDSAYDLSEKQLKNLRSTPLFLNHGTEDDLLDWRSSKFSYKYLEKSVYGSQSRDNFKLVIQEGLGHSVDSLTLESIKEFVD